MKGKRSAFALAFAFAVTLILSGMSSARLAAQDVRPASAGTWACSGALTQVSAPQIEQLANDRANILREYGITAGERREYADGSDKTTVTLYRMVDPSAAFGAFTFLRDPDMAIPAPLTAASYAAGKRGHKLLVLCNLLVDVASAKREMTSADLTTSARGIAAQADLRPYPPIPRFLPTPRL